MTRIYTKTGDSGESSIKNERLRKDALVFDVLGDLDELNSWIGFVRIEPAPALAPAFPLLESVQRALIALSADVAGHGPFATDLVPRLEAEIDRLSSAAPFRIHPPEGRLHVVRAVCRRAERRLVAFGASHPGLPFLNRLSDYLYALAESVRDENRLPEQVKT